MTTLTISTHSIRAILETLGVSAEDAGMDVPDILAYDKGCRASFETCRFLQADLENLCQAHGKDLGELVRQAHAQASNDLDDNHVVRLGERFNHLCQADSDLTDKHIFDPKNRVKGVAMPTKRLVQAWLTADELNEPTPPHVWYVDEQGNTIADLAFKETHYNNLDKGEYYTPFVA